jgi:flagellar biosynthetic protein FliO
MEWIALKAIFSLIFVLVFMGLVLFLLKKYMFSKTRTPSAGADMQILGTLVLHPKKSIHIIKVANKFLVVGVTDSSIHSLSEFSEEESAQLMKHVESAQQISSKSFTEYFTEYLGIIGWRNRKKNQFSVFQSSDTNKS